MGSKTFILLCVLIITLSNLSIGAYPRRICQRCLRDECIDEICQLDEDGCATIATGDEVISRSCVSSTNCQLLNDQMDVAMKMIATLEENLRQSVYAMYIGIMREFGKKNKVVADVMPKNLDAMLDTRCRFCTRRRCNRKS